MKKMLALMILLVGCSNNHVVTPGITKEDVELANCICQKQTQSNASLIRADYDSIAIKCEVGRNTDGTQIFEHRDLDHTVGCSKFSGDK